VLKFEWDDLKASTNLRKHQVSFEEASSVFHDRLARIFDDPEHSLVEPREIIIGYSEKNRLLLVSFTERGPDLIRIISARKATRAERTAHEKSQGS
jgi:uncharacterized DUF497 family protein